MKRLLSLVAFFATLQASAQQVNPVPDYVFANRMSAGRNTVTDTAAYFSIGPRYGATRGMMPPMVVDTASFSGNKRNGLLIFSVQKNKFLYWDSVGVKWAEMAGTGGSAIAGSGTINYIPKFTAPSTIGNSQITDNGTTVGSPNINFPNTSNSTNGVIAFGGNRMIHKYKSSGAIYENLYFGSLAGNFTTNDSAYGNVGVGYLSLEKITSAWQNTAVGAFSQSKLTTGSQNASLGYRTLTDATSAYANTSVGNFAHDILTTGYSNTAVGEGASRFKKTGFEVVAIGHGAGYYDSTNTESVYIGNTAGPTNKTFRTNQIAIGSLAENNESNATVIGNTNMSKVYLGSTAANADLFAKNGNFRSTTGSVPALTSANNGTGDQLYLEGTDGGTNRFYRLKRVQSGTFGSNYTESMMWETNVTNLNSLGGSGGSFIVANNGSEIMKVTSAGVLSSTGGISTTTGTFSGRVQTAGSASTTSGLLIRNPNGASGTAQYYTEFGDASNIFVRTSRGNGASGLTANGLNIDNWEGFQIRANQLGGSGGSINLFGGEVIISTTTASDAGAYALQVTGNIYNTGSITTGAPSGGSIKPWKIGEAATVSPTLPNRTLRVEVDGVVYYIHAKTTND